MKPYQLFRLALLLLSLTIGSALKAQQSGQIVFDMKFPGQELSREEQEMLPKEATMYFKGDAMRMEMPSAMMTTTVITVKEDVTTLMDMMGNKIAMKADTKKSKEAEKDVKVNVTGEKKTIAGYECKKALVTGNDGESMEIWFTDKIKTNNSWNKSYKGVDGTLLEFAMKGGAADIQLSAREVKLGPLNDDLFTVPSDYKVMTQEEMMQMMGGGK